jgi:hypothetical protein
MDASTALELDYLLCDLLQITMDTLDSYPLSEVIKMREIASPILHWDEKYVSSSDEEEKNRAKICSDLTKKVSQEYLGRSIT